MALPADPEAAVAQIQADSELDVEASSLLPAPLSVYEQAKLSAAAPGGKFNEKRRAIYLAERRRGTPHMTAVRRAGIGPATYDRYSAAVGQVWKEAVRYARDEGLDPIRAVRRAKALEGEPWAVRAEIGEGKSGGAAGVGANGVQINAGVAIIGGADGIAAGLGALVERLRAREAALTEDVQDAESWELGDPNTAD